MNLYKCYFKINKRSHLGHTEAPDIHQALINVLVKYPIAQISMIAKEDDFYEEIIPSVEKKGIIIND